jgi:hypothetical protein
MIINPYFQHQHRRLREKYGLPAVERHETQVMAALEKRYRLMLEMPDLPTPEQCRLLKGKS